MLKLLKILLTSSIIGCIIYLVVCRTPALGTTDNVVPFLCHLSQELAVQKLERKNNMPLIGDYQGGYFEHVQNKYNQQLQNAANPIGPGFGNYGTQDVYRPPIGHGFGKGGYTGFGTNYGSQDVYNPPSSPTPSPQPPPQPSGPSPEELARQRYEDEQRGNINRGWDAYTQQLNDMLNVGLPGQRTAQEDLARTSYEGGIGTLGSQKQSSEKQLEQQKVATLKDLTENLKNLFTSGNIYLGARGAGDSSAADQYSYALQKMGTKERGDILTQVNQRANQISDIYNTEVNRLESEKTQQMAQIANWFQEAQNSIRSQVGQAGLGRSQDLQALSTNVYNQALSAFNQLQQQTADRRNVLENWAANNSQSIQELVKNFQAIGSSAPQFMGVQGGMPQVDSGGQPMFGYGGYTGFGTNTEKDIFGQPIR